MTPDRQETRKTDIPTRAARRTALATPLACLLCACALGQTPLPTRSIRDWATCDGKTDDNRAVVAALAAAKHNAFTLLVDCPVFIHVGSDIARPIFIDNGTNVTFAEGGLFITDNVLIPEFVLANSSGIRMENWRVEYRGRIPADANSTGYLRGGRFIQRVAFDNPGYIFNDLTLTPWLAQNRGIIFEKMTETWYGPTNTSAMFFFIGSTSNVTITGMHLFVPQAAEGSDFIGMAFSFHFGFKDGRIAARATPTSSDAMATPNHLIFRNIDLDGYYMGWCGQVQDTEFENIRAHRYGDLQDEHGGNVGGLDKWFAPPHLFYLTFDPAQTGLEVRNVRITDVIDYGNRVGTARDKAGQTKPSGYANSLKIGGYNVTVDHYTSYRPDGLLDVLACDNMTISNVAATYDSSFINNIYPGIRFPQGPPGYHHLTLENVQITDTAATSTMVPINGNTIESNSAIRLVNVTVTLNRWAGSGKLVPPRFAGNDNLIDIRYTVKHPGQ